jgi:ribonuclease HI
MNIIIHTDGGARGNPGPGAIGFVICKIEGDHQKIIYEHKEYIGICTNNVAEYQAVISALDWIGKNITNLSQSDKINFYLDSLLVVQQINGIYKVKNDNLKMLLFKVRQKENAINTGIGYFHVNREQNMDADKLVNAALDETLIQ